MLALRIFLRLGRGRSRLVISLTSGFVSVAKLLFLLIDHIASAIDPIVGLFARPARLVTRAIGALLRLGADYIPRLVARLGGIQHTDCGSYAETRKKPQKAAAVTIRHHRLLNILQYVFQPYSDGSTGVCERQFTGAPALMSCCGEGLPSRR